MDEYRTWRLCTLMRCRPSELDGESAVQLDWLLAIDDAVSQAKAEAEEKAARQNA